MAEVGRIQIEVDARQVDKATRALNDLGLKAQATGRKVDGYEKQTKQATKATDKMANSSRKLTRMFGLLSAGIGGLTFVGLARSIERATTQLNNIEATMRVATGSSQAAGQQIAFIREESERLGLFFPTVAKQMAQFSAAARGTTITSDELKSIFTGISEASRAMGLTAPEAEGAMKALQQMMSKGKVSAEELRQQLGERMPGSIQIMARSLDVTTQELFKMMENGELLSDEVLPKFADELSKTFSGEASQQAERIAASIQRLQTAFFNLMSQGDLSGASKAINELAETISQPEFQDSFDKVVQGLADLLGVAGENIDVLIELSKILGILVAIRTAKWAAATVGGLNGIKKAASFLTGPYGRLALLATGLFKLGSEAQRSEKFLLDLGNEAGNLKDDVSELDQELKTGLLPTLDRLLMKGESLLLGGAESLVDSMFPDNVAKLEDINEQIAIFQNRIPEGGQPSRFIKHELDRLREEREALLQAIALTEIEAIEESGLYGPKRGRDRLSRAQQEAKAVKELVENQKEAIEILARYDDTTAAALKYRDSLVELNTAFETLNLSAEQEEAILADVEAAYREATSARKNARDLMEDLFPERRAFREYLDGLALVESALEKEILTAREAAMAREELNKRFQEATAPDFDEIPENFAQKFEDELQGIGQSLADAMLEGDFEGVGQSIGDLVGTQISKTLSESIGESLGEELGQGIGQSIGTVVGTAVGGTVGAVVGQAAGSLLDDLLGDEEFDLEAVQARQNTGTVLGSINQKSSSIDNSLQEIQGATEELVNINTGMLRSLQQVQNGIARASARVAGQQPGAGISAGIGVTQADQAVSGTAAILGGVVGAAFDEVLGDLSPLNLLKPVISVLDDIFFNVFSSIGSALFGGDRSVVNRGVQIIGGEIDNRLDETLIRAFARIKEEGGFFSSDDYFTKFVGVPGEVNQQFQLVLGEIVDSVRQGAEALGVLPQDIQQRLNDFVLKTRKISLKGLDAEEQQEEIQAAFSAIFDRLAAAVVPFAKDFQNAGEGIGETIARLATEVGVFEELALSLGESISGITGRARTAAATGLASRLGGTENFAQAIATLEDNFFTEAEQFEANSRRLKEALDGLPLPDTRDGFVDLIRAQDEATKSGRENIATLLRLQGSADEYYSHLEDFTKELNETASSLRLEGAQQSVRPSAAFERGLQQAIAGDEEALQSLPRLAKDLSSTRMNQASTLAEARAANARIASQLENVSDKFSGQRSHLNIAEDQLEKMSQQENLLQQIADNTRPPDDVQGYRNGGIASGPESGYTAMLHGTEAVIPLNGERIPLEVNNEEMINELRNLRNEVNQLRDEQSQSQYQITKNTKRTRDTLEKFDIEGLPPERT